MKQHTFSWVGGGQLSRALLPALLSVGYSCKGWYLRRPKAGTCAGLRPQPITELRNSSCDLVYLAVSDDALPLFSSSDLPRGAACVHFSATAPSDVLSALAPRASGLCYPLQSFANPLPATELARVPFFIESSDAALRELLAKIVHSLGAEVKYISETQRKYLHLSAVFANNFTNHLLRYAKVKLEEVALSFDLLRPLLEKSTRQAFTEGPEKSQSGPARRGDSNTCRMHESILADETFLLQIYKLFSKDITKHYSSSKNSK